MKHALIFLPLYAHENQEAVLGKLLGSVSSDYKEKFKYRVVSKPSELRQFGKDVLVITDDLHRLSDDAHKAAQIILDLLESGCELWIPSILDLRKDTAGKIGQDIEPIAIFSILASLKKKTKSARIKQSLFVKKQLTGAVHSTSKITPDIRAKVIEIYKQLGGIRATARTLGISISPASVHRIIKEYKNGQE